MDLFKFTPSIYPQAIHSLNLKLYELDANTLSLENLAGGTWKNFKMGALELTSTLITGGTITLGTGGQLLLYGTSGGLRLYGGSLATCDTAGNIPYLGFLCKTLGMQDTLAVQNSAEGGTASLNIKTVRELVTLSGAQKSTTINLPAGAMLLGAAFNVNTAVVTSAATNTWDADFTGGSTTNLVAAGALGAQNTKANKLIVPEIASAETNIEFDAPGVETFSSGVIEVVAYYIDQTSLANA